MLHAYVYVAEPPIAETVRDPSFPPLQLTLLAVIETITAEGSEMVPVAVVVQPPFSVTVTVYDPADKPVTVAEVAPVLHK